MSLNKIILIGRLVRDAEVKIFSDDVKAANFTLAVDRRFRGKNDSQHTDFIPVTVWRRNAEFAETHFSKGKQVYVSGALETYSYEQDGRTAYGFRVTADEIGFADTIKNNTGNNTPKQNRDDEMPFPAEFGFPSNIEDDDIPFNI